MKIVGLKCPYCGAEIKTAADRKYVTCEYCQSALFIDQDAALPVEKSADEKRSRDNDDGYEKKAGTQKPEEPFISSHYVADTQKPSYEKTAAGSSYASGPAKKRISIWTVILWILFFPVMFLIWFLRRKKVPVFLKYIVVLSVWALIVWLGKNYFDSRSQEPDLKETAGPVYETEEGKTQETESEPAGEITTQETTETDAPLSTEKQSEGRYAPYMNGRGRSDNGTVSYVGVIGYAVTGYKENLILERRDSCFTTPWQIPVYEKDKQFFEQAGTIDHKTEVLVLSQDLKSERYGRYSGYLYVRELETGREFYLDVNNFITRPYWEYTDLIEAAKVGDFLAEYHPVSDYYPVARDNDKVELEDGFKVLVTGLTGTYGKGGPDKDMTQLECVVFKEWKYGYGGVDVFFNTADLELIY